MKRIIWLRLMIAAVCFSAACSTLETDPVPAQESTDGASIYVGKSFHAGSADTRTTLGDDLSILWKSTDRIAVFDNLGAATDAHYGAFTTTESGPSVVFSGKVADGASAFYALYPYDPDAVWDADALTIRATLSPDQTCVRDNVPDGCGISVAKDDGKGNLFFRNVLGVYRFTITRTDVEKVVFTETKSSWQLAGQFYINVSAEQPALSWGIANADNKPSSIIARPQGSVFEPGTYYVYALPRTNQPSLDVKVYTTDGQVSNLSGTTKFTIAPGEIFNVGTVDAGTFSSPSIFIKTIRATDSTVSIAWTTLASNYPTLSNRRATGSFSEDAAKTYDIELYKSASLGTKVAVWKNVKNTYSNAAKTTVSQSVFTSGYYPPRWVFSGLAPATTYYVRIKNTNEGVVVAESAVYPISTAPSANGSPVVAANPVPGDIILFENFSSLLWGGDITDFAAGYSRLDRTSLLTIDQGRASGDIDLDDAGNSFIGVRGDTEMGLFSTLAKCVPSAGLAGWSAVSPVAGETASAGNILARPGYLKIGANSAHAGIVTPPLSAIPANCTADVEVRFSACPYVAGTISNYEPAEKDIAVKVLSGGNVSNYLLTGYSVDGSVALTLDGDGATSDCGWQEYSVTFTDVESTDRISIMGNRSGTNVQSRFMVDDIQVRVLSLKAGGSQEGFYGLVRDEGGEPVPGVTVSDGLNVTQTGDDGMYYLPYRAEAQFVFITVPAEFEVPYDADGYPAIYRTVSASSLRNDFTLARLPGGKQTQWTLFSLADPQTKGDICLNKFKTWSCPDIKAYAKTFSNVYGVALGDINWNSKAEHYPKMRAAMAYSMTGLHIFPVPGNHDYYVNQNVFDNSLFRSTYGPDTYSWDRGDCHIVMMDDILEPSGSHDMGDCVGGVSDERFLWMQRDLALVDKDKCVVFCAHVPLRDKKDFKNREGVLRLLSQFRNAYILVGHVHFNYISHHDAAYATRNGKRIREYEHPSVCGLLWYGKIDTDGSPAGYEVFQFDGVNIVNRKVKGVGYPDSYQIRCYDGHATGTGTYINPYGWQFPQGTIVANVFAADGRYSYSGHDHWTVELWQNGEKCCDMNRIVSEVIPLPSTWNITWSSTPSGTTSIGNNKDWWTWHQVVEKNNWTISYDYSTSAKWSGRSNNDFYYKSSVHLYYGLLTNTSDLSNFEVRVTDNYGNTYTCSELTAYTAKGAGSPLVWDWSN